MDKTARIYGLLTGSGGTFSRRCGKFLLCSTLGTICGGRRELFARLDIDSLGWDWKTYPVIRIDLNAGDFERGLDELFVTLNRSIEFSAQNEALFTGEASGDRFARLILKRQ